MAKVLDNNSHPESNHTVEALGSVLATAYLVDVCSMALTCAYYTDPAAGAGWRV